VSAPPRYVLNSSNSESIRILDELQEVNNKLAYRLTQHNVYWISVADIISGKDDCDSRLHITALYSCWSNDPVHGDKLLKLAYTKLAMGILTALSGRTAGSRGDARVRNPRKRFRDDSPAHSREKSPPHTLMAATDTTPPLWPEAAGDSLAAAAAVPEAATLVEPREVAPAALTEAVVALASSSSQGVRNRVTDLAFSCHQ